MSAQVKSLDRIKDGLKITWQDGQVAEFNATFLRKKCPCAVCRPTPGHGPAAPIPDRPYQIKAAHPVGWYALQFVFDDGHETGIYTYEYLRELAE